MNGENLTRRESKKKPKHIISRATKGSTPEELHDQQTCIRWKKHAIEIIEYAALELRKQSVNSYVSEAALDRAYEDIRKHNRMTAGDQKN